MKKSLLIIFAASLFSMQIFAQCSPNFIYTVLGIPGIYPPNIPNIPFSGIANGQINAPYSQTITLVVPEDTTIDIAPLLQLAGYGTVVSAMNLAGISTVMNVDINYVTYDVSGLPNNLTYTCNMSACQYPAGTDGCIQLSGTPTITGTFPIDVNMTINIQIPPIIDPVFGTTIFAGIPMDLPSFSGQQYDLLIDGFSIVEQIINSPCFIYPNPTHDMSFIKFSGKKNILIYDYLGRTVWQQNNANEFATISKQDIGTGIFRIEISDEKQSFFKNLIIQ